MTKFVPGGPERFAHQKLGLNRLIKQRGVGALLFDPGLGKTGTAIDFISVLALKKHQMEQEEARVLVVCPLVAVDTWVAQMGTFASPDVNFWAEAVGGNLLERSETLASRGGQPYSHPIRQKGGSARYKIGRDERTWHYRKPIALNTRPVVDPRMGPNAIPGPRVVMEVVNIDTLQQRRQVGTRTMADVMVEAIRRFKPDLLIVDESHKIKSPGANASRLLARLTRYVPRRIILTGTVMPTSPMDVFAQWRFLDPFAFGNVRADGTREQATFGGFRNRYAKLGGYMGKEVIGFKNLDQMQDVMAQRAIVARKEDALDLPKTTDVTLRVEMTPKEKKAYAEMKKDLATAISKGVMNTATSMLTQALRLRQITSGHLPDDQGEVHTIGDSKVKTIRSLIHDTLAGEKRVVVFALFTHEIRALTEGLKVAGTTVRTITGATPMDERMAIRREFGSDSPDRIVLVAQIKTLSLAVNELVTASHAVFASMSQQRDDYIQARDRLNRLGQTRPVTFWHAIAPGTVDEVVLKVHQDRSNLENAMLKHIQGTP